MLVEIELVGIARDDDDPDIKIVAWKEKDGRRRLHTVFSNDIVRWIYAAWQGTEQEGLLMAHAAILQFMLSKLGISMEKLVIPGFRSTNEEAFQAIAYFKTPAGTLSQEFLPSDAIAFALHAKCPIYIEESHRDEPVNILPKTEGERPSPERHSIENATQDAKTLPDDKLPKA